ncbi:MAG: hypothetical protein ACI3XT_05205 [Butyricicoccaceae bacterium]
MYYSSASVSPAPFSGAGDLRCRSFALYKLWHFLPPPSMQKPAGGGKVQKSVKFPQKAK